MTEIISLEEAGLEPEVGSSEFDYYYALKEDREEYGWFEMSTRLNRPTGWDVEKSEWESFLEEQE